MVDKHIKSLKELEDKYRELPYGRDRIDDLNTIIERLDCIVFRTPKVRIIRALHELIADLKGEKP